MTLGEPKLGYLSRHCFVGKVVKALVRGLQLPYGIQLSVPAEAGPVNPRLQITVLLPL